MAFTDAQKVSIRNYLGFSENFHQINTRLESMLIDLPIRSPAAEALAISILAQLAAIDAANQTTALTGVKFKKAEDVEWNLGAFQQRQDYGRSLIQRLAILFEVTPMEDYYGAAGGGGGVIPLG